MKPKVSFREAISDPQLLGHCLVGPSWKPWRTFLIAAFGEPLIDDEERSLFAELTGGRVPALQRAEEIEVVAGRRGGKSNGCATAAAYLVTCVDFSDVLTRGEKGCCLICSPDIRQSGVILSYALAAIQGSPLLSQQVVNVTADTIELTNSLSIETRAASVKRLRGPTYVAIFADELAFFPSDSSVNPDAEILNSVRPGLATTGGPMFMISSPYAKRGVLWETFKRHYGPAGDKLILVAKATSRQLNPTLLQSVVDRALERDPAAASAEYLAEFRNDLSSYVSLEAVMACITKGTFERAPVPGMSYEAFCDMSGGAQDSAVLCIGHNEPGRETIVIDCVREIRSPHSPEAACAEFSAVMRTYGLTSTTSDKYASGWPLEQFSRYGVLLRPEAAPKSALYSTLLASLNSKRVDLLDNDRMVAQIVSLERRTGRGADSIDHPPGQHDDVANAVAGLVAQIISQGSYNLSALADTAPNDPHGVEGWRQMRLQAYMQSGGLVKLW
jgi:hypothetical protein